MFRQFGAIELLMVLSVLLLIFGPSKLPALGKAIGRSIRGFRDSVAGTDQDNAPAEGEDGAS